MRVEFVRHIPEALAAGTIYVSVDFATVVHRCCCGCGNQVVTPLSPTDWTLTFDGESISLDPSIGNWSFPCRSHYWIRRSRVRWARDWSEEQIEAARRLDRQEKQAYFREQLTEAQQPADVERSMGEQVRQPRTWLQRLLAKLSG